MTTSMIALIDIAPPAVHAVDCQPLLELPTLPAMQWSAFLIRCGTIRVREVLAWCWELRLSRPYIPVGLVCDPDITVLQTIAAEGLKIDPLLVSSAVRDGLLLAEALERLRQQSISGRIVDEWLVRYRQRTPEAVNLLATIAALGTRGAGVARLCKVTGRSSVSLYHRLQAFGRPQPGYLLRAARVRSVEIARELGASRADALHAAGWFSPKAFVEQARRRLRHERICGEDEINRE